MQSIDFKKEIKYTNNRKKKKKKNSFKWSPLFCWMMIQINSYDKMEYR